MRRTWVIVTIVAASFGMAGADRSKLPFTVSKETTDIIKPLKADGSPDYLGAINAEHSRGVTPENNGFVVWVKLVGAKGFLDPATAAKTLAMLELKEGEIGAVRFESYPAYAERVDKLPSGDEGAKHELDEVWKRPWKGAEHPRLAAYLKEEGAALDAIVAASKLPKWWVPYASESGRLNDVKVPGLGQIRGRVNALCARVTLRAGNGDWAGCIEDIMAGKRIGRQLSTDAFLIEVLVGIAMDARGSEMLGALAGRGLFTDAICKKVTQELAQMPALSSLRAVVNGPERWSLLDLIVNNAAHRTNITADDDAVVMMMDWDSVNVDRLLQMVNGLFNEEIAMFDKKSVGALQQRANDIESKKAVWGRIDLLMANVVGRGKGETVGAYTDREGGTFATAYYASYSKAGELEMRDEMKEAMAQAIVVAAADRARIGVWPKTLDELPADIYAEKGGHVRYVVNKEGVAMYSVGGNGKDDGGVLDRSKGLDDVAVGVETGGG